VSPVLLIQFSHSLELYKYLKIWNLFIKAFVSKTDILPKASQYNSKHAHWAHQTIQDEATGNTKKFSDRSSHHLTSPKEHPSHRASSCRLPTHQAVRVTGTRPAPDQDSGRPSRPCRRSPCHLDRSMRCRRWWAFV
jgi:hypothetical protein